jgi:exopolysaccharide production protein ExoQ
MDPRIAAALFAVGIVGLNYLDRDRESKTSPAIWLAVVWVFLGASRNLSQWLEKGPKLVSPEQYLEGSPVDRLILSGLVVVAIVVLLVRSQRTFKLLQGNGVILLFFAYCLLSVVWSDFPMVALKRWTKALGNLSMVMLVLTDSNPAAALKRLLARTGFLLVPISLLVIKYYPEYGRGYLAYSWEVFYSGAATDKNGLGVICLLFGLGSLWQFVSAYGDKQRANRSGSLVAHGTVLVIIGWLLHLANSSTALACFGLGSALLLMTTRSGKPGTVHGLTALIICGALFAYVFPDAYDSVVHLLGRKPDLTGRTDIWNDVFKMHINPLLGTGFESFWLGSRAEYMWSKYIFHPNQAHNGYIEMYLNLGWIGVILLAAQFLVGYRNVVDAFRRRVSTAPIRLSLLVVATVYNITEAAFKVMHPMWIAFLIAIMAVPDAPPARTPTIAASEWPVTTEEIEPRLLASS